MRSFSDLNSVVIGGDPEIAFVTNKGAIVPCAEVIRNSRVNFEDLAIKYNDPKKGLLHKFTPDLAIYSDGASCEFNLAPTNENNVLIDRLRSLLLEASSMATRLEYRLAIKDAIKITKDQINKGGVALTVFGCDPDRNIWRDHFDPSEVDASLCFWRFFGGHIHVSPNECMEGDPGWYELHIKSTMQAFDLLVGLTDVLIDGSVEAQIRRNVYGRAGRYRIQPWGVEYRTPGCMYLRSPYTTRLMFNMARLATYLALDFEFLEHILGQINPKNLVYTINSVNKERAKELWTNILNDLKKKFGPLIEPEFWNIPLEINAEGGITHHSGLNNFYRNWRL